SDTESPLDSAFLIVSNIASTARSASALVRPDASAIALVNSALFIYWLLAGAGAPRLSEFESKRPPGGLASPIRRLVTPQSPGRRRLPGSRRALYTSAPEGTQHAHARSFAENSRKFRSLRAHTLRTAGLN